LLYPFLIKHRLPTNPRQTTREYVYFWSRDKDGGYTIWSVTAIIATLQANCTTESSRELGVIAKFYIAGIENLCFSASVTSTQWPSYANLTGIPWRYCRRPKMNSLCQDFQKLLYYIHTDIQTDVTKDIITVSQMVIIL